MKLLLDTSVFLWFVTLDARLPQLIRREIRMPANEVWLSAVSFWEVVVKYELGKLPMPEPPARYVPRQRERHSIEPLPLREEAIVHLGHLPDHHRDPFDRMLVCQAIEHEMMLVTGDPLIRAYPVKTLWT